LNETSEWGDMTVDVRFLTSKTLLNFESTHSTLNQTSEWGEWDNHPLGRAEASLYSRLAWQPSSNLFEKGLEMWL